MLPCCNFFFQKAGEHFGDTKCTHYTLLRKVVSQISDLDAFVSDQKLMAPPEKRKEEWNAEKTNGDISHQQIERQGCTNWNNQ